MRPGASADSSPEEFGSFALAFLGEIRWRYGKEPPSRLGSRIAVLESGGYGAVRSAVVLVSTRHFSPMGRGVIVLPPTSHRERFNVRHWFPQLSIGLIVSPLSPRGGDRYEAFSLLARTGLASISFAHRRLAPNLSTRTIHFISDSQ